MATNHHHHQCHCHPTTTTCHCTMCYTTTHYPPPPPPPNPIFHSHHHQYQHQYHQHPPQIHQPQITHQENSTVSSLIRRISALESTLLLRRKQSPSLRDAAARTIQTHFRTYLVQRSITLRHLQHLARIKSSLNRLKSSLHPHTVSRESMALLIKLDSIQGSDPMIRDGKRSISRELFRFMELTEKQVKNAGFGKKAGSRVFGYKERKFLENLKNARKCVVENGSSVSRIRKGDLGKARRNVRFDEDGNVYRLFKTNGDDDDDDEEEVEVEEVGVSLKDTQVEEDGSSETSGNETDPRTRVLHRIKKNKPDQEEDDDNDDEGDGFVFSAPLPAKMEY